MPIEVIAAASRYVSYLRVSTNKQGSQGLGIEAQRETVRAYLQRVNHGAVLLEEFVEVESGRKSDRPKLQEALSRCELAGAKLVIAKLDRLSRDVHFLTGLEKAGVDFVACDLPDAGRLSVHIMAVVAQYEAERISERTKDALKAAKARGTKLGNPNGAKHLIGKGNTNAVTAIKARATKNATKLIHEVQRIQSEGFITLKTIANKLNERGILTPRRKQWHPQSVKRLLMRLDLHSTRHVSE
jgi:DNA invertase Pin-like site-specific DNA recombinase